MSAKELKRKERNTRPYRHEIDLLGYDPLINKVIHKMAQNHGTWVYRYKEELYQEGYIGLMQAFDVYDRERGTFVTIAYLRIWSAMQKFINTEAKLFVRTENLEAIGSSNTGKSASGKKISWEELIPSHEIDYGVILRLAVPDRKGRSIINHVIGGTRREDIPKKVNMTVRKTRQRIKDMREDLIAVCNEMYLESNKLKVRG